jgi:hypothetical protein
VIEVPAAKTVQTAVAFRPRETAQEVKIENPPMIFLPREGTLREKIEISAKLRDPHVPMAAVFHCVEDSEALAKRPAENALAQVSVELSRALALEADSIRQQNRGN